MENPPSEEYFGKHMLVLKYLRREYFLHLHKNCYLKQTWLISGWSQVASEPTVGLNSANSFVPCLSPTSTLLIVLFQGDFFYLLIWFVFLVAQLTTAIPVQVEMMYPAAAAPWQTPITYARRLWEPIYRMGRVQRCWIIGWKVAWTQKRKPGKEDICGSRSHRQLNSGSLQNSGSTGQLSVVNTRLNK